MERLVDFIKDDESQTDAEVSSVLYDERWCEVVLVAAGFEGGRGVLD